MSPIRIPLPLVAAFVSLVVSVSGCGGTYELEQAPVTESAPADEQLPEGSVTQQAICSMLWTCNYSQWYGSEANCTAACGRPCTRDYRCNGTCV
ncbi:hypothetical protein [Archangium minus]|uniref:hypothetical protein n=1 Tax=Archangium minus TaxID=83450 RepID=UPI0037C02F08